MQSNELEKTVVERFLADASLDPARKPIAWDAVLVKSRSLTGVGFITEFEVSQELKLFRYGFSVRWGRVGARLNVDRIETGYLVYVDGGQITTVEGYTYGAEWPSKVETIEMYELKEGVDLENPPIR